MRLGRLISVVILAALALAAETAQQRAAERQRASVEKQTQAIAKQRLALEAQDGAFAKQKASVARQKAALKVQPGTFESLPPVPTSGPSYAAIFQPAPCQPLSASALDPILSRAARENSLAPELLRAVIRKESAFRPCAVSSAGAMGLMQLMPGTAQDLQVSNPFDPAENISAGSRFLRYLLNRYGGDTALALGAYNAGPTRVDQAGGVPSIPQTQDYVADIMSWLR